MDNTGRKSRKAADPRQSEQIAALERELQWTRFAFELEEKLARSKDNEFILQSYSDHLKSRVAYDYMEISLLPTSECDIQPSDWVRNETGYGGKLLSILLTTDYLRGLPRRIHPINVELEDPQNPITNPELLRIMGLTNGVLMPILDEERSAGVLKLFFRPPTALSAEAQNWIKTSGSILYRALKRSTLFLRAQKMATTDGLTGLYNRRYFMEQLAKEFVRSRRYRNWLSLIIVDIDYFKQYNDANGHLAGDSVLKRVANAIKDSVREIDLVARWGGEEFALLLPEINGENGMIVAEKIRREIESERFRNERKQPNGNLTVSLGVAQNSTQVKSHLEMFNHADVALYRAKLEGRNRCVFAK